MKKSQNDFGHHVLAADKGKILTNGEINTLIYISDDEINESDWTEVDAATITEDEELSDGEALAIITGGQA